jgi:hypothetical protein
MEAIDGCSYYIAVLGPHHCGKVIGERCFSNAIDPVHRDPEDSWVRKGKYQLRYFSK